MSLEHFVRDFQLTLSRNTERAVMTVIDTLELISLKDVCSQAAQGHKKETLLRLCEADPLGISKPLKSLNEHLKTKPRSLDQIDPVALKAQTRAGPLTSYIMFPLPTSICAAQCNEFDNECVWDAGIYVVTHERFSRMIPFLIHAAQATYQQLLRLLFEVKYGDIDERPVRLGRLDRTDNGTVKFFARYNMRSHGALNTVTFNSQHLPITLCPLQWSYQPDGYDSALWLPHWNAWLQQFDDNNGSLQNKSSAGSKLRLEQVTFIATLIPSLQAFHDRPLPSGIDAVYGSWTNLTLIHKCIVSPIEHTLQPIL
jgi:hypothetical protein